MEDQKLTVWSLYRVGWPNFPDQQPAPLLQLAGFWLAEAGFSVGSQVVVRTEHGRLVVTLQDADVLDSREQ